MKVLAFSVLANSSLLAFSIAYLHFLYLHFQYFQIRFLCLFFTFLFFTHSLTHSLMAHSLVGPSRPPSTTLDPTPVTTQWTQGPPCPSLSGQPTLNAGGLEVFSSLVEHGGSLRCPWPASAIDGQETVGPCGQHDQRERDAVARSDFQCEEVQCDGQPQCFSLCGTSVCREFAADTAYGMPAACPSPPWSSSSSCLFANKHNHSV